MVDPQDSLGFEEERPLSLDECTLEAIQLATRQGWAVAYFGEGGIQFVRRKCINPLLGWISFALIFLYGIGLIFCIALAVQYMMDHDKIIFISTNELLNEDYYYYFGTPRFGVKRQRLKGDLVGGPH